MMKSHIAHIRQNGDIQTVREHCVNAADYAAEEASAVGLNSISKIAGLLHDIGKDQHSFQEYILSAFKDPKSVRRGEINHSSAGGRYALSLYQQGGGTEDTIQRLTSQIISYAVISHHGLTDCLTPDGIDLFNRRNFPEKDIHYDEVLLCSEEFLSEYDIKKQYLDAVAEIRNYYDRIVEITKAVDLKHCKKNGQFLFGCLQRLVLSFLVDADRRDTAEFMSGTRIVRLSHADRKELWEQYQIKLEERLSSFRQDRKINRLRKEMSDLCRDFAKHGDGIYRLSIPTGGGKTYAGMRYALELANKTNKSHIFYIAPFLSVLEQNAKDIRDVFGDSDNILEHHSNILIEDEDKEAEYEKIKQYELMTDDWSSPVILTTMVQFLNVLTSDGMQYVRRFHQLKESVIIIDEAQSVPVKCIHLFTMMMNFISGCLNSTIVLCTATQPLFEKVHRKILYSVPSDMIPNADLYAEAFMRTTIENALLPEGYDTNSLTDFLISHFQNNLLMICNTKTAVKKICSALKNKTDPDVKLIQLTTYMCAAHRIDVIEQLKDHLKNGSRVICISTQLIEAGVDISFETVVRSVAGLDSIAQAAGRCNRNAEKETGCVYIVNYNEEKTGALEDIYFGQIGTKAVLDHYQGNLLMPEAMSRYYQQYYFDRQQMNSGIMDYNIISESTTLYNLLSYEKKYLDDYKLRNRNHKYPHLLSQAFRTAGREFSVIDEGRTVNLIVPYKKVRELIKEYETCFDPLERKKLLKKMQRYTVTAFKNDKVLKGLMQRNAVYDVSGDGSIRCVDEPFYNDTGIDDEIGLLVF